MSKEIKVQDLVGKTVDQLIDGKFRQEFDLLFRKYVAWRTSILSVQHSDAVEGEPFIADDEFQVELDSLIENAIEKIEDMEKGDS